MATSPQLISIPTGLLPADGRFGCGPSKIRPEALKALVASGSAIFGTSHRQAPVRALVGSVRAGLRSLFHLPDGYEIVIGNGGSTAFWDIATLCLIESRSQHLVFGEFSSKFADAATAAPFLGDPTVISVAPGSHPMAVAEDGVDVYALTHNETSTGVAMALARPAGIADDALVVVDATSAAGGITFNVAETDVYYFAPQKCFAADGGLWVAIMSPRAIERARRIAASGRWIPAFFSLTTAIDQSQLNQTYNTPALATLHLFNSQLQWMLDRGGLPFAAGRSLASSQALYEWASRSSYASPFVANEAMRSPVVGTIDLDPSIDFNDVCLALRANGIVDTDPYRKLGRNQLRVGMFPAIDSADVVALTACIDYVVSQLT